jgi:hypothetical protein
MGPLRTTLTACPECAALAEVAGRFVLESTDGPIEHVRVRCLHRHWFAMPTAALAALRPPLRRRRRRVRRS